jgi:hypothetical protein
MTHHFHYDRSYLLRPGLEGGRWGQLCSVYLTPLVQLTIVIGKDEVVGVSFFAIVGWLARRADGISAGLS